LDRYSNINTFYDIIAIKDQVLAIRPQQFMQILMELLPGLPQNAK